jgi:hypothetical protein
MTRRFKTFGLLFALLGCSIPAQATWSTVHISNNSTCSSGSATCVVSLTAPTLGNSVWVTIFAPTASVVITQVSGGQENWTVPGGSCNVTSGAFSLSHAYALTVSPGGTGAYTVTVSPAPSGAWEAVVTEIHTTKLAVFDACNTAIQSTTATPFSAPSLTLSGNADYVGQTLYIMSGTSIGSIDTGYTIRSFGAGSNHGVADLSNVTSYSAPNWSTSSTGSTGLLGAIAFKEVGSVGFVQFGTCGTSSGTTCTITLSAVGAGHLLAVATSNHTLTTLTDSSTGSCPGTAVDTFTHISAADAGTNAITWWWVGNSPGGATAICATFSGTFSTLYVVEFAIPTTAAVDQVAVTGGSPSSLACPSITTSGGNANEAIVNIGLRQSAGSGTTSVSNPWDLTQDGSAGAASGGAAFLDVNATGTYQATWARTGTSAFACSTVSFSTGATPPAGHNLSLLGVGN